jgi:hypothetical protein
VSVDTSISGGASQVLAVPVGNVLASLGVSESLGEPEINDVDIVLLLADPDEEVVWLYVSVQEVS